MDWESVWKIMAAIAGSVGVAGAIIFFVGKWLANLSAEALLKKKEFEFDRKLEDLKSKLKKRNYISKVRFDLEIETYRQLSEAVLLMAIHSCALFPIGLEHGYSDNDAEAQRKKDIYTEAVDSYNQATQAIMKNAPFIPKNMYELFSDIRSECKLQIDWFPDFKLGRLCEEGIRELRDERKACRERTKTISDKLTFIIETLRNHIAELDVLEQ